jgi:serine/alanine adding enzyme
MEITIVDALDETVWKEFVNQQPQGNIFHTPEMFQVFSRTKHYRPVIRAAVNQKGQVLAILLPVQISLHDGLLRRLTTRSIVYGSSLCRSDESGKEALAALLRNYTHEGRQESLFTEFRHLSDLSTYQSVFKQCGLGYKAHLNYLVDLDCSPEEIFNKFGPRTRKHIRREIKKGQIVVEEIHEASSIQPFYELIRKSYLAANVPIVDISMFDAAFDILYPRQMIKFSLARLEDRYIASSVELTYKDVIYGWYGGVDRDFSSFTPNEFLTWHILKWGAENGYRTYDFGGAGSPDEKYGVRDFKSKFGGQLVCYGRNTYVHAPALLFLSSLGYQVLRHVVRL